MIVHHFIYVFCAEARDNLLKRGYTLLHKDERQKVWVFENKGDNPFPNNDYAYVLSDTLSI